MPKYGVPIMSSNAPHMCVEYAIPGTGFPSTSPSVIVSGRVSDLGAYVSGICSVLRGGLRSTSIRQILTPDLVFRAEYNRNKHES